MTTKITVPFSKEVIKNVVAFYKKNDRLIRGANDISYHRQIRALGFLEAVLQFYNKVGPDQNFQFKEITYFEPKYLGLVGKKVKKKRKQTYAELILEKVEELLTEL